MSIKDFIKFIRVLLIDIILKNKGKMIFLIIALISFIKAGTYDDVSQFYKIVHDEININGTYIYIYEYASDSDLKHGVLESTEPLNIVDGKYWYLEYNGANALFWILFIISIVILIGALIIGINDSGVAWKIDDSWEEAFKSLISCEEEEGKYYYLIMGRLISIKDRQINAYWDILSELNIRSSFRKIKILPKYQTKKTKRQSILSKLGI